MIECLLCWLYFVWDYLSCFLFGMVVVFVWVIWVVMVDLVVLCVDFVLFGCWLLFDWMMLI